MKWATAFEKFFRRFIPEPLTLAVILTLISMGLSMAFGQFESHESGFTATLVFWQKGLWNPPLLVFMVQMMLILVLGHALALSPPIQWFIKLATKPIQNAPLATALVCLVTLLTAFINWGLGLILGAILAREMAKSLQQKGIPFNYPLLGAAAYAGFLIWHGGFSGSAPLKVAETGHLSSLMGANGGSLPEFIPIGQTILSHMNLWATGVLVLFLPFLAWVMAKKAPSTQVFFYKAQSEIEKPAAISPSEKLDRSRLLSLATALLIIAALIIGIKSSTKGLGIITPNFINFTFLALGLLFHKNLVQFGNAINEAVKGASGIVLQFPLYFGIMGVLQYSGLIGQVSDGMVAIANEHTLPIFTFISAGIVNFFVPSGGGQWVVQGPIIIEASQALDVPLAKSIMALAYGDQITNMLQPFWALPLLGITQLKAKEILPYTMIFMLPGILVYLLVLSIF